MRMKTTLLLIVAVVTLMAVAGTAFAQDCCGAGGSGHGTHHGTAAAAGDLPPAENMISLTGTVVSVAPNGAALVDTGTAKLYVLANPTPVADGQAPAAPFKVGDQIQVAGVLLALQIQPTAGTQATEAPAQQVQPKEVVFGVSGIMCGMCVQAVQAALTAAPGVTQVEFDQQNRATVTYDPSVTNPEALAKAIAGAKHPHAGMTFKARLIR